MKPHFSFSHRFLNAIPPTIQFRCEAIGNIEPQMENLCMCKQQTHSCKYKFNSSTQSEHFGLSDDRQWYRTSFESKIKDMPMNKRSEIDND